MRPRPIARDSGAGIRHLCGMPRYYFHLYSHDRIPDEEGVDLPDLAAARMEAVLSARELMAADVARGRLQLDQRIEVTDENSRIVLAVPFRDIIEIRA